MFVMFVMICSILRTRSCWKLYWIALLQEGSLTRMAPKLPNHLASLLRHQPTSASASTDAEETGKTARKKAARIKRRAKAKEDRAAEREEKLRRLQEELRQKAETKVDPPKDEAPKKKKKKLLPKKKKLTAAIPRAREGTKVSLLEHFHHNKLPFCCIFVEPLTEVSFETNFLQNGFLVALRYRKMNQRHQPLSLTQRVRPEMHHFYMTWRRNWVSQAIANEGERKRKQIFQDLFEEEDLGIEELPSSDENETAQASSVEGLKESDIVGLLDTILGQGEMTSTSSIKTQGSKSKKRKSWDGIKKCHP